MIALTSHTAAAIALHAAKQSWIVFLQAVIHGTGGPVLIGGVKGRDLVDYLGTASRWCPDDLQLIGLLETQLPDEDARVIADEFGAHQIHDWWFQPVPELLLFIQQDAQSSLPTLLSQTHPGGLSDAPVDAEEMAKILGISLPTLRRMIKSDQIPYLMFGRFYRFVPRDVLASLKR